jgi:hypothetical protein
MDLTLNRDHPLCNRNLLFASFGTGHGGQVLDLSDRPSHGMIVDDSSLPSVGRSLQSVRPPGFPSDWEPLTFRSPTAVAGVQFGNVAKVNSVTSGFTAACWVRQYWTGSQTVAPFGTALEVTSGWLFVSRVDSGASWMWLRYQSETVLISKTTTPVPTNQWTLLAVTFVSGSAPILYTNGVPSALSENTNNQSPVAGDRLNIGTYTNPYNGPTSYPPNADIGPCLFWGSVLTADDVKRLYDDTWGMVTQETPLALRVAASAQGASTSGHTRRTLLGVG